MFFHKAQGFLLDILFPPLCLHCHTHLPNSDEILCVTCLATLTPRASLFCGECMRRLPEAVKTCHLDTPYILGAAGTYDDAILQTLIHNLKYEGVTRAATLLGNFLAQYTTALQIPLADFFVVPVPLSKKRLRVRGYNQAELIARVFAERLPLPVLSASLMKKIHTKPQMGLPRKERLLNLEGCFVADDKVKGKHILLVDDVSTSGATLFEASRALKKSGARKIVALVVAKA